MNMRHYIVDIESDLGTEPYNTEPLPYNTLRKEFQSLGWKLSNGEVNGPNRTIIFDTQFGKIFMYLVEGPHAD